MHFNLKEALLKIPEKQLLARWTKLDLDPVAGYDSVYKKLPKKATALGELIRKEDYRNGGAKKSSLVSLSSGLKNNF